MIEQWEAGDFAKPGPKGDPGEDGVDGKDGVDGVSGYEASNDNANGANTVVHASQATDLTELDDGTSRATGWMVRYTLDHVLGTMKVQVTCASAE